MRSSVVSLGFLLLIQSILACEEFQGKVKVGKKSCTCSFSLCCKNGKVDPRESSGSCDKKCSGAAKPTSIGSFMVKFAVKKGKVSKLAGTCEDTATVLPPGSGSGGPATVFPPGSGSGGPATVFPPGSGSGSGGPATVFPPGSGSGGPYPTGGPPTGG